MPFGLTIGTERAVALQHSIQDELMKRGFSTDADPVMSEYITIMVINNKTAEQITGELEDLIGSDFDPSFTEWLFTEAAKGNPESESPSIPIPSTSTEQAHDPIPHAPDSPSNSRRIPSAPRNGVYQQALSQALPTTSSAHKRTASARSPSPSHPNKTRRTGIDLPTGPRAMFRDNNPPNPRSLLDRVGARNPNAQNGNGFVHDDIQARIDNIVSNSPDQSGMMLAANGGFPGGMGMVGMDVNPMMNPMMLQDMMMNQMALMAQMASSMGMLNQNAGYPGMQGVMPEMGMFPPGAGPGINGFGGSPQMGQVIESGRGRGRGNGRGRGIGRGRGGPPLSSHDKPQEVVPDTTPKEIITPTIAAPIAVPASTQALPTQPPATQQRTGYVPPVRPLSPTLCKFGPKCTNTLCRYSHPSPVATPESGMVLSNEACEKGVECKDKDCVKGHVSPAVTNPQFVEQQQHVPNGPPAPPPHIGPIVPCRFGAACTRPNCTFSHPPSHKAPVAHTASTIQCRFGASCTRATCPFQHPEGRVLPTTFHRGLSTTAPVIVNVPTPEAGSMGPSASPHRSMTFSHGANGARERLKEIEEKKNAALKAAKDAEAAVANKKDESKPVAITA